MPVLTFPEPDRVKPLSVADAMAQWAQIDQMKQSGQMNQMRIADMQRKQQQQDQLRGLYANGQRPTADQLYSVDPELGMEYENTQARNQKAGAEMYMKTMPVLKDISTQIRNKVAQSGVTPESPQFQQTLDAIAAPYRPYMSTLLGKPDDGKPADWNAINMLADFSGATDPQDWIVANDAQRGSFMLNKKTGEVKPLEHGGRQIIPPQYSPELKESLSAAEQGPKGVEVTDSQGRTYRDTQSNVSGGRIGLKRRPADNIPQMGVDDANILMMQAREDNPDTVGRDKARAILEGLAAKSGGGIPYDEPVKGPTPGEKKANEITGEAGAKAALDLPKIEENGAYLKGLLDKAYNHPGLEGSVGLPNFSGAFDGIRGTKEKDFNVLLEQIQGKQFMSAFDNLRGGGQITEQEGAKATAAMGRLSKAQSEEQFKAALDELRVVVDSAMNKARGKAGKSQKPLTFNSPGEVKGALTAGLIDKQQAHRILVDQFGFEDE